MYKDIEVRWSGELPGTPQQVWDGFTKRTAAWIWDIDYEPRVGGSERGLTSGGGTVTAWQPPRHFRTEAQRPDGWHNALDYALDGTHLTYVHTSVMDESTLEIEYDACVQHTRFYYHSLGEYLRHFAGRSPHYLGIDDVPGSTAEVLERLGIPETAGPGDRVDLGVIDYRDGSFVGVRTEDSLLRVYGRDVWGWPVGFAVHAFDGAPDERAWREILDDKAVA
jgi:hypothetical protein